MQILLSMKMQTTHPKQLLVVKHVCLALCWCDDRRQITAMAGWQLLEARVRKGGKIPLFAQHARCPFWYMRGHARSNFLHPHAMRDALFGICAFFAPPIIFFWGQIRPHNPKHTSVADHHDAEALASLIITKMTDSTISISWRIQYLRLVDEDSKKSLSNCSCHYSLERSKQKKEEVRGYASSC